MDTIQENEIFNLADKVDYREGTFHPQAALRNDKAELFLMAVDAGVLIPDHKAPSDLIFQALEGEAVPASRKSPKREEPLPLMTAAKAPCRRSCSLSRRRRGKASKTGGSKLFSSQWMEEAPSRGF